MVLNHHYCLFALQTMSSISISPQVPRKVATPIIAWATVSFVFHMCQALSSYFSSQTEPIPQTHIFQKEILIFNFRETDPAFNAELIFVKSTIFSQIGQRKNMFFSQNKQNKWKQILKACFTAWIWTFLLFQKLAERCYH